MTTLYVAGPMSGYPEHNYPAFRAVTSHLRAEGHTVLCPTENFGGDRTLPKAVYMLEDLRMVLEADAIALLPGWQDSEGARLEALVARETAKPVYAVRTDGRRVTRLVPITLDALEVTS